MCQFRPLVVPLLTLALAGTTFAQPQHVVFPTLPHAADNFAPFNILDAPGVTHHQVYASSLFADLYAGEPVRIEAVGFAPTTFALFDSHVVIRLGYTHVQPPAAPDAPVEGGGGAPNATGDMHVLYDDPTLLVITTPSPEVYQLRFEGSPFEYDPALGNLLIETVVTQRNAGVPVARSAGSSQSTRSYVRHDGGGATITPNQALLTEFAVAPVTYCYADCDENGSLDVNDFICFIDAFAHARTLPPSEQIGHYANCTGRTSAPILSLDDFICFIDAFAAGCP